MTDSKKVERMTTSTDKLAAPLANGASEAHVRLESGSPPTSTKRAHAIEDAATQLGVSPATIWKYAKLGRIRLVRIGGRTLMPETVLQEILARGIN